MARNNYPEMINWLEKKGKSLFTDKFHFVERDIPLITKLICYFIRDEAMAKKLGLDLNKGILLIGPVGCGKTTLMNLMRHIPELERKFFMKSCRDISFEFIKDGYEVFQRYSYDHIAHFVHKNYCFDDIGAEKNIKYFGNECNVMAEILLSRYEIFVHKNIQTFVTSNLSAQELEQAYGNRVRSRLRAMVNLVAFDKDVPDKR